MSGAPFFGKGKGLQGVVSARSLLSRKGGARADEYPSVFFPSAMLVPLSRLSLLRRRRAIKRAVALGVIGGLALAAMSAAAFVALMGAKAQYNSATQDHQAAEEQVKHLLPVGEAYVGFEERQTAVAEALASDIDYSSVVQEVQAAIQAEIPREALAETEDGTLVKSEYSHIGLASYSITSTPCPTDEPFRPEPSLGCLQGNAVSSSYAAAGEAISLMNSGETGLFGGYILNAADGTPNGRVGATSWSFSINLGSEVLSGKYAAERSAILGGSDVLEPVDPATTPTETAQEVER